MCAEEDCGHAGGPHLLEWLGGHGVSEQTIDHQLPFHADRQKDPGIGAACPHRINQISTGKDDRFAGNEVRCGHSQGDSQFLKSLDFQDAVQESRHAVVGAESKTGDGVAGKILEADNGGDLFEFLGGDTATVCRSDHGSNAGAGNEVRNDALAFQGLQHTHMS